MIKSKVRVLIVESVFSEINSIVDELLDQGSLSRGQINVTQGTCEALHYLDQCSKDELPSIVLLSVELPDLKGVDFLKALNKNTKYRNIPSIVFSQSEMALDISECYQAEGSRVVGTPIDSATERYVVRMIDDVINPNGYIARPAAKHNGFLLKLTSTIPFYAASSVLFLLDAMPS